MEIPFNKPFQTGKELDYIRQVLASGYITSDGEFSKKCNAWLEQRIGSNKAQLTNSCTAALELAAMLLRLEPGDEVIMPSYTFVSTANAFVLRGAVPVFVDCRPDTLNIDETKIAAAITKKTKAIVVVHYAGVSCEMDSIMELAKQHNLIVIEDAAQAIEANYKGRALGSIGHMATFSFHQTKNIIAGEAGALLINSPELESRAEIIKDKGTNRGKFFRGEVDKYTWVDLGLSSMPSELVAAFLLAQLEAAELITRQRLNLWGQYHQAFATLEQQEKVRRPIIPGDCSHNAHIYYLLLPSLAKRDAFIQYLKQRGIASLFHFVPLHNSPMGLKVGRASGQLHTTLDVSCRIVRLPLWLGLEDQQVAVIEHAIAAVNSGAAL